jgi:hypothetical protein
VSGDKWVEGFCIEVTRTELKMKRKRWVWSFCIHIFWNVISNNLWFEKQFNNTSIPITFSCSCSSSHSKEKKREKIKEMWVIPYQKKNNTFFNQNQNNTTKEKEFKERKMYQI